MKKTIGIIITFVVFVIVIGFLFTSSKSENIVYNNENQIINNNTTIPTKETKLVDNKTVEQNETITTPGSYEPYATEKLDRAKTGKVVLFFHASWCPSCRGLETDINKNLSNIPSNVNILKVNYDSESVLKQKYGVTYQHTMVQVDSDGIMIKKWSGSPTLNSLVSQIN